MFLEKTMVTNKANGRAKDWTKRERERDRDRDRDEIRQTP